MAMAAFAPETIIATFVLFCRFGSCLMVLPGFGSDRIPAQVRLALAVAASLSLAPMLVPGIRAALPDLSTPTVLSTIISEVMLGVLIGLMGQAYFIALQTLGTLVGNTMGLSGMPGTPIDSGEPQLALVNLITVAATALIFVTDLHLEAVEALVESYAVLPVDGGIAPQARLASLVEQLAIAFFLALRLASPFIVYAVVVNFAVGLVNKVTPQIPAYFIATPFIIAGGFYFLAIAIDEVLMVFIDGFSSWLRNG